MEAYFAAKALLDRLARAGRRRGGQRRRRGVGRAAVRAAHACASAPARDGATCVRATCARLPTAAAARSRSAASAIDGDAAAHRRLQRRQRARRRRGGVGARACRRRRSPTRLATMPQVPGRLEILHDAAHRAARLRAHARRARARARRRASVHAGTADRRLRLRRRPRPRQAAGDGRASPRASADVAIVTSDNPRTEDPERILDDIEAGMGGAPHERIEDRRDAIARALELARPGRRRAARRQGARDLSDPRHRRSCRSTSAQIVQRDLLGGSDLMADAATPQASALEQPRFWTLDRVADALGDGSARRRPRSRASPPTRAPSRRATVRRAQGREVRRARLPRRRRGEGRGGARRARRAHARRGSACRSTW